MSALGRIVNLAGRFSRNDATPSCASARLAHEIDGARVDLVRLHGVIGAEHAPEHLARQRDRHRRGVVGDLARQGARRLDDRLRRDDAAHQTRGARLLGVEDATGVDPLGGAVDAHDAGQEPAAARLGDDTAACEDEADLRRRRRDADVHRQGHRDADTDRGTVDRGDHGLLRLEDAQGEQAAAVTMVLHLRRLLALRVIEGRAAAGEIRAGAERASRAGHDDGADRVVAVGAIEGVDQLAHHGPREGVQLVGALQGDGRDGVGDVIADLLVGHRSLLPRRGRSPPAGLAEARAAALNRRGVSTSVAPRRSPERRAGKDPAMADLETFREDTRRWLKANAPASMYTPLEDAGRALLGRQEDAVSARRAALARRHGRARLDGADVAEGVRRRRPLEGGGEGPRGGDGEAPPAAAAHRLRARDDRPAAAAGGQRGAQEASTCRRSSAARSAGARATPSRAPAPTSRACRPGPSATATSSS